MANGKEIKAVYDMMKKIYVETHKLLIAINDRFEQEGFEAVGDNSVMWGKWDSLPICPLLVTLFHAASVCEGKGLEEGGRGKSDVRWQC